MAQWLGAWGERTTRSVARPSLNGSPTPVPETPTRRPALALLQVRQRTTHPAFTRQGPLPRLLRGLHHRRCHRRRVRHLHPYGTAGTSTPTSADSPPFCSSGVTPATGTSTGSFALWPSTATADTPSSRCGSMPRCSRRHDPAGAGRAAGHLPRNRMGGPMIAREGVWRNADLRT
jgi:hypothetical protein